MKKRKAISIILSLAAAFGSISAVPVSAESEFTIADGYQFVDIAHNGNTYVAMAKESANWTAAKLYTSTDGGLTWESSRDITAAKIDNNTQSQQQLVYWEDKDVFVTHCTATTLTSEDGSTWTANAEIHWAANTYLTVSGGQLILSGGSSDSAINAQDNLTTKQYSDNKYQLSATGYLPKAVAAKPEDPNGDVYALVLGSQYAYYVKMTPGTAYSWSTINQNAGGSLPQNVYDMLYASGADQFLAVTGTGKLFAASDAQNFKEYEIKADTTVTGIGASDSYIVAGLSDGSMYYTANTAINDTTEWEEIPAKSETTACTEPVKNIEFSDATHFTALSETQIYKADINQYCNINEYVEETEPYLTIGEPYLVSGSQVNPFAGVRLIGGTYSSVLGKYVVYGDTTEPVGEGKYWG